jgi:hypothetical protein
MKYPLSLLTYLLTSSYLTATVTWVKFEADLGEQTRGIDAADLDGDGNLDIVATGSTKVFTVLNPTKNKQPQVLWDVVAGELLYGASADLDNDGDLDFVVARGTSPWIDYRERRARREKIKKPKRQVADFSVSWIENTGRIERKPKISPIDNELHGCHGLAIADINGDGTLDVVGNSIKGDWKDSIAWYDNFEGKFVRHMITQKNAPERPHYMDTGDFNDDGKLDLVVGHSGGNTLSWYQNPPSLHGIWKPHTIAGNLTGVTNAVVADIDGDKGMDVVSSNGHGNGVNWYRGNGWKESVIEGALADCHSLAVGDFDLDGDIDVVTASFSQKIVRWYENSGVGVFRSHEIDTGNGQESYDLKAVDLNKDGRLDLLLAGRQSNNAVWYINQPG